MSGSRTPYLAIGSLVLFAVTAVFFAFSQGVFQGKVADDEDSGDTTFHDQLLHRTEFLSERLEKVERSIKGISRHPPHDAQTTPDSAVPTATSVEWQRSEKLQRQLASRLSDLEATVTHAMEPLLSEARRPTVNGRAATAAAAGNGTAAAAAAVELRLRRLQEGLDAAVGAIRDLDGRIGRAEAAGGGAAAAQASLARIEDQLRRAAADRDSDARAAAQQIEHVDRRLETITQRLEGVIRNTTLLQLQRLGSGGGGGGGGGGGPRAAAADERGPAVGTGRAGPLAAAGPESDADGGQGMDEESLARRLSIVYAEPLNTPDAVREAVRQYKVLSEDVQRFIAHDEEAPAASRLQRQLNAVEGYLSRRAVQLDMIGPRLAPSPL